MEIIKIIYFNTKSGRFHGFGTLLKNLKDNMADFKPYCAAINHGFLNLLKKFKISGDSSAHTLELYLKKEDLEEKKDLEHVVKTLINILNNIQSKI